jgi:thiosulfate/3-mercaptopyruvate sulfurtransferase
MTTESVSPADLADRLAAGEPVTLLDVRNRDEIESWRIGGADRSRVEVPYTKFVAANATGDPAGLLPGDAAEPVVAVCGRGEASDEVAAMLRESGVDARNLADGMRGWARVYRAAELDADAAGATVVQYRRPSSGCLAYLVVAGGEALVVDPLRAFADRYAADARERGARLATVVDTHVHADHVSGLRDVTDATSAMPVMSDRAGDRGVAYDVETVEGGDALQVGDVPVEVVATPGHTSGMVSLAVGDVLLCGDTLFVGSVPRPDLEAGDDGAEEAARELHRTMTERLSRFDDDTVVAPGHYSEAASPREDGTYVARLGVLRERLFAFDVDADEFVDRVMSGMPPRPANVETIVEINLGREAADDEDAFELELGPNNCAATAD